MAGRDEKDAVNILVIDDSAYSRRALTGLLESMPGVNAVSTAVDGIDGYRQTVRLMPDLIMLDLEMPNMDGFSFLRMLRGWHQIPVVVVTGRGFEANAFKAFELGAMDFIEKPVACPSEKIFSIKGDLARIISNFPDLRRDRTLEKAGRSLKGTAGKRILPGVIAAGASTGGPAAISALVRTLPRDFHPAFLVSMHMPEWLTAPFVERLQSESEISVKIAENGCKVENGCVLVAPGGYHMSFVRVGDSVYVRLIPGSAEDLYAPSIDLMLGSAAEIWGERLLGIIMTGMGSDGKEGVIDVKNKGGYVMAESRESSVIFSMPYAAISTGKVDEVLSVKDIGDRLRGWVA